MLEISQFKKMHFALPLIEIYRAKLLLFANPASVQPARTNAKTNTAAHTISPVVARSARA
jgi:hypothetical protein